MEKEYGTGASRVVSYLSTNQRNGIGCFTISVAVSDNLCKIC